MKTDYIPILIAGKLSVESRRISDTQLNYVIRISGKNELILTLPETSLIDVLKTAYRIGYYQSGNRRGYDKTHFGCAIVDALIFIGMPVEREQGDPYRYLLRKIIFQDKGIQQYPHIATEINTLVNNVKVGFRLECTGFILSTKRDSGEICQTVTFRLLDQVDEEGSETYCLQHRRVVSEGENPLNYRKLAEGLINLYK